MENLVIIGHGMVAQRLLERLAANGACARWNVTVIGAEPQTAYNRILLSSYLAGDLEAADLPLADTKWYDRHGITCLTGTPVMAIDRSSRQVKLADDQVLAYDQLVLATGAEPLRPELPGADLDGVQVFRDWADSERLRSCPGQVRQAVVIGGGFLGLEAAAGLNQRGVDVTVLQRGGHLLNRQLDPRAGQLLSQDLSRQGLTLRCHAQVSALEGRDRVTGVRLTDGTLLAAQLVVFATGIRPRRTLAERAGLACERGIRVDAQLRSSDPRIAALGECCQRGSQTYGLVEPGYRQAEVLAARLRQPGAILSEARSYSDSALATRLKISGLDLFSCGETEPTADTESLIYQDQELGHYRHLLIRDQRLVGVILYGDVREGPWYFQQLQNQTDISAIRQQLAFGAAYCEAA